MSLIDIQNLIIKNQKGKSLINGINLKIYQQKVNALIGESGAGKSLTVKALLNFLPSDLNCQYDHYYFNNKNVNNMQQFYGRTVGYISQNYAESFNDHSKLGKQLIAIYRTHFKVSKEAALSQIDKALSWVNLSSEEILKKYSFQLSGGQLERVYIASVLMLEPELIIADEPVASLDVINGYKIMDLLQHIVKEHGQTLFIITHNLSHVLKYCDYINVIKDGDIVERGDIKHFKYDTLQHLSNFDLDSQLLSNYPNEVSGGQLQRFNVMRSLLAQPRVLICDEITSNLDVIAEQNVISILKEQTIANLNHLVVISHDLSVLQRLVNRIIVIKDGAIVDDFETVELFNSDRHPYTKELTQAFTF
ncbi:TPA: ATP-binding cassette domain-containing protein [Staphylococcus aureus]|nr:ATP-binding cassette domain-containing protein [Staphylococcus aureus]HDA0841095.1 ATP-binding cassette domain-containing protein [Staphylococcus aureus]HDA3766982.1 ATP-binding cassette domain-containing protein [Staphylococcus aureus]